MQRLEFKHGIGFFYLMQQCPDAVTVRPELHVSGNLNRRVSGKPGNPDCMVCLLHTLLMAAGVTSMLASIVVSTDASNGTGRCQHSGTVASTVIAAHKVFLMGSSHTVRLEEAYMHSD